MKCAAAVIETTRVRSVLRSSVTVYQAGVVGSNMEKRTTARPFRRPPPSSVTSYAPAPHGGAGMTHVGFLDERFQPPPTPRPQGALPMTTPPVPVRGREPQRPGAPLPPTHRPL